MQIVPFGLPFWEPDYFALINLLAIAALYLWAAGRAKRISGQSWSIARTISFLCAITVMIATYLGPFSAWSHTAFWPHMMQHIAIMMVAGPLIVMSNPITLTFINLGPNGRRNLVKVLRSRPMKLITNPYFGWFLFAFVLLGTHVIFVMEWILNDHDAMLFIERPVFLAATLIFYYPLMSTDMIAKRPAPGVRVVSLGLMMIPETVLGMVIHFAPIPLYPTYIDASFTSGLDPLTDQKFAGALMWALGMVLDGIGMMLAALQWWKEQEKETDQLERQEAMRNSP
jgi:putative copper resistance protein D